MAYKVRGIAEHKTRRIRAHASSKGPDLAKEPC